VCLQGPKWYWEVIGIIPKGVVVDLSDSFHYTDTNCTPAKGKHSNQVDANILFQLKSPYNRNG
jgi:hypothetical protein